jgi:hypothetical protein
MAMKFEDLLVEALRLPAEERQRLTELLRAKQGVAEEHPTYSVQDDTTFSAASDHPTTQLDTMTHVTVVLPDDLAKQAKDAGLLAGKAMEKMIRRALHEQTVDNPATPRQQRRLVRENGYLVVEALPGEKPITSEAVRDVLNDMEW